LHDIEQLTEIASLLKGSKLFYIQNFIPKNTYNNKYMDKNGFPPAKLEEFRDIFIPYVDSVEIRN
ncbi:MAG: anaerobic ribonucleoside-triphosphate reductase activating protein, partial [bacterium]